MKYIDADTIAECQRVLRQGVPLETLAGRLDVDPEHLGRMLGLPSAKPVRGDVETGVNLWAADRAHEVL